MSIDFISEGLPEAHTPERLAILRRRVALLAQMVDAALAADPIDRPAIQLAGAAVSRSIADQLMGRDA